MDQITQHETRFTKLIKENVSNGRELISTGKQFLNKIPLTQKTRSKHRIFKKGNSNGRELVKENFNFFSHKGNANQNCYEFVFCNCQNL